MRRIAVLAALLLLPAISLPAEGARKRTLRISALKKSAPESQDDLKEIEQAALEVAEKVVDCTVGLQVGRVQGSGVIISADGLILTAAHVVGGPDRPLRVRLPDGRVAHGKSLGLHTEADLALAQITDKGKWPFAPYISIKEAPRVGDWCLATGHPGGFRTERSPPVRVGRLIDIRKDVMRTDCPVMGGDSGGPLFDMQGRVIGIHSRISEDLTVNLHGPLLALQNHWETLKKGGVYPKVVASQFLAQLDRNKDGKLSRAEMPEGPYRRVFDQLIKKLKLPTDKPHSLDRLSELLKWRPSKSYSYGQRYSADSRLQNSLMPRLYVRGAAVRSALVRIAESGLASTVTIRRDLKRVALGAVVGKEGWIASKSSELKGTDFQVVLHGGRKLPAVVVARDVDRDLALLRTSARNLKPVRWAKSDPEPGRWVITPGPFGAATLGVISVPARKIRRVPGVMGVEISPRDDVVEVARVSRNSGAASAGIQPKDEIVAIEGKAVANLMQLRKALSDYRAGDTVKATIRRAKKKLVVQVTLGSRDDAAFRFGRGRVDGPLSRRRDDFAQALQHDTVLLPSMCGGPLTNVAGETVGLNIARANRIAAYALPARTVQAQIEKMIQSALKKTKPKK